MKCRTIIASGILLFLSCVQFHCLAQVTPIYNVTSPEASGLGEFGAVPVSYFTGIPNISIPLYEVKFGNYSIPITADYHLASVRPNDTSGCLGLGWSLVADGVISRTVRGICDERRSMTSSIGNGYYWHTESMREIIENPAVFDTLTYYKAAGSTEDDDSWFELSVDEFSFCFLGYSGNFYLNEDGGWTVVCDQDIKVEFNPSTGFANCHALRDRIPGIESWPGRTHQNCFFIEFTLITPDGVRYTFGGVDATDFSIPYYNRNHGELVATSWHLKKIVTPEGYEVNYSYLHSISEESILADLRYIPSSSKLCAPEGFSQDPRFLYSNNIGRAAFTGFLLYSVNLNTISTPNEQISFEYHNDIYYGNILAKEGGEALYWDSSGSDGLYRTDSYVPLSEDPANQFHELFPAVSGSSPAEMRQNIADRLRSYYLYRIRINCLRGNQDKSIFFSYTYQNRRKVSRIAWREGISPVDPEYLTGGGMMIPIYRIPENTSDEDMPEYSFVYNEGKLPQNTVFPRTDRWGYYNGMTWKPADPWPGPGNSPVNFIASLSETLKEVVYPTGGRSVFEYDGHQCSKYIPYPGSSPAHCAGLVGGLRIASISNYDRLDNFVGKIKYYYTDSIGSNISSGISSPEYPDIISYTSTCHETNVPRSSGGNWLLTLVLSSECGFPPSVTNMNSPSVGYSCVIEETLDAEGHSNGYVKHYFSNFGNDIFGSNHDDKPSLRSFNIPNNLLACPYSSLSIERGRLLRKDYYSSDGDHLRREDYHYSRVNADSLMTAIQRYIVFCADPSRPASAYVGWLTWTMTGGYLPVMTETIQYDGEAPLTSREETGYNSFFLPVERRSYLSDDRVKVESMTYSTDCPEYSWMTSAHILNRVASISTSMDGISESVFQHYSNAKSDGSVLPFTDRIQLSSSEHITPWTVFEVLSVDDWGNPTEIVENGRHTILFWGNKGQTLSLRIDDMTMQEYVSLAPASIQPTSGDSDVYFPEEPLDGVPWAPEGAMATSYLYNGKLQLRKEVRPDGVAFYYDYDSLDRLKEVYYMVAGKRGIMTKKTVKKYDYHLHNGVNNGDLQAQEEISIGPEE